MFSLDLLFEAVLFGVLLGCFYAAVSIGLSVSFGLLDVPHVAHPAIMVLGSYCTWLLAERAGWDPLVAGTVLMVPFFFLGVVIYRFYYEVFEKRGSDAGVRGLAFFFGLAFIIEVGLILAFGVDQRSVEAAYIGKSFQIGEYRLPMRMVVAFVIALVLTFALTLYLSKTFTGRAIKAVAQDEPALRLMGANPVRIKQWAFGIATGVSHVLRGGAGRAGQHDRHARRRPDPRHRRVHRADDVRRLLGAGGGVRPAAGSAGRPAARTVRKMSGR
jgi:branched-chain amino acid transport system permease protein